MNVEKVLGAELPALNGIWVGFRRNRFIPELATGGFRAVAVEHALAEKVCSVGQSDGQAVFAFLGSIDIEPLGQLFDSGKPLRRFKLLKRGQGEREDFLSPDVEKKGFLRSELTRIPVDLSRKKRTLFIDHRLGKMEELTPELQAGQSVKSELRFQARTYDEQVATGFRQVLAS